MKKGILLRVRKASAMMLAGLMIMGAATVSVAAEEEDTDVLLLSLQVYNIGNSGVNEVGQPVEITGDGQYTLTYDIATDLSEAAKSKGITAVKDFGSLYIKDYNVTTGKATKSPITAGTIVYDKIEVDGKEVVVNANEAKDILNQDNVVDTGNPINAWNTSVTDAIKVDAGQHTASFKDHPDAQKVTVTFTLSGLGMGPTGPTTMTPVETGDKTVEAGSKLDVNFTVTPISTDIFTISSSDESVAKIDSEYLQVDAKGNLDVTVEGVAAGKATITVKSADDITTTFDVTVTGGEKASSDSEQSAGFPTVWIAVIAGVGVVVVAAIIIISVKNKKK